MRLLLCEDERSLSRAVEAILRKNNYSVDAVYDGKDALDYIVNGNYDGVILDIMMPVMDGYQALMGIRHLEKERNIPKDKEAKVIMTTALNDEGNVKMAFELGCTVYSGKPIDQDRFEQVLKKFGLIE